MWFPYLKLIVYYTGIFTSYYFALKVRGNKGLKWQLRFKQGSFSGNHVGDDENLDHAKSRYVLIIFCNASIFSYNDKGDMRFPYLNLLYITQSRNTSKVKAAQSRYFELFWPHTKLPLNGRKPENNSLIR